MNIALLQLNLQIGDPKWNAKQIRRAVEGAVIASEKTPVVCVAPELAISGAPLEELFGMQPFLRCCQEELHTLAMELQTGPALIVGAPEWLEDEQTLNSAVYLLNKGSVQRLTARPLTEALSYGTARYATQKTKQVPVATCQLECGPVAVMLGETEGLIKVPEQSLALIVLDCEPFESGSWQALEARLTKTATAVSVPLLRVNPVGGSGSWVFAGGSMTINSRGQIQTQAIPWKQEILLENLDELHTQTNEPPQKIEPTAPNAESHFNAIWHTLVLGIRDYVRKNGFSGVVLGLSGGIDSAVVAALAVDAVGAGQVTGFLMPSPWSSQGSLDDATTLANNLGIKTHTLPIKNLMDAFEQTLAPVFQDKNADVTEENIQARIRGSLLMAHANKFQTLLLATGNKSEVAMGYGTLYGDLAGGLAPIADIYKTDVYRLASYYNECHGANVIPQNTIDKAPSAELRPGQKDQDSLPPYDKLDAALHNIVEGQTLPSYAICPTLNPQELENVAQRLRSSEFKRHQAPLGLFVSAMPFALLKLPLPTPKL